MFQLKADDREFLEYKYHDPEDPSFDPYNRMYFHGYEYPADNGLNDAEMDAALKALTETPGFYERPHPVVKAELFAFLLDHARIEVNAHDWYACFYNWGRPISPYSCKKWDAEVFSKLPEIKGKIDLFDRSGAVAIWPDFDHVIPGWTDLLTLGFPGLLKRAEEYHKKHREKGITPETEAFFTGIEISYRAILRLLSRYEAFAERKSTEKSPLQALCYKHLSEGAPKNTYEALQAMYLFFILCECVDHFQTRSLGNGFDSTLLPFWKKDIESGAFTKEQLDEFIAYFLMQYSAIGNYWGHPMYLGGTNEDGSTRYTELSSRILSVYGDLGIYNPKVQIKVNYNTPKDILFRVFELIRQGKSSFVFCCEPGMKRAVMSYGATEKEAADFEISGCYETRVRGNEASSGVAYVNALKAVELTLRDGKDPYTGEQLGPHTGSCDSFTSFEEFYEAFKTQWMYLIEESIRIGNSYEPYLAEINPSNLFSGTLPGPLKKGVDGYAFGMKFNNSCILNCGFASAVDAVMAVKALCFDERKATLPELTKALDRNWEGYEELRAKALGLPCKYGNEDPETVEYSRAMAMLFANRVNGRPNARGGVYKAIMHTAMEFVWQGERTLATPDGRLKGEETSKNASPVNGMDKKGVTALIHSALSLSPWTYQESLCVDALLHPTAVSREEGSEIMYALIMTYLKGYGQSIQFNIFNAKLLRDAQAHPEKYRNLQVRVCGWNVLWNNLSRAEQDAYILRAENVRD